MQLTEIRVAGFGGQGVILSAIVIGKAASIYENGFATMTQNFGPEARGGACSAQVILSDNPILYPYVTRPEIMVVMSQEAYNKFAPELKPNGLLLVEQDSGARFQHFVGHPRFQLPGNSHRRGPRQAHGVEFRDGRFLWSRFQGTQCGSAALCHRRFGSGEFQGAEPESLRSGI